MDKKFDVGVLIGRFQTDDLTPAQMELIESVYKTHSHTVIILGISPLDSPPKNPLDYRSRKVFVAEKFPKADIVYANDMKYDDDWSRNIDKIIATVTRKRQSICLYGGRDSFIPYYSGKHQVKELTLKESVFISATARRKEIRNTVSSQRDFRKGIIYGTAGSEPRAVPAVIIAIFDEKNERVLMGRTFYDRKYQFITEYLKANKSCEQMAVETAFDQTGIKLDSSKIKCQGSFIIPDWKYRGEDDTVIGMLYTASVNFGTAEAKEDLVKVKWINIEDIFDAVDSEHYTVADFLYHYDLN